MSSFEHVVMEVVSPTAPGALQILRAYMDEFASRCYGRQATEKEIDAAIRADPIDDLILPRGVLLLAHANEAIQGCAGLRLLPDRSGEIKRVFVVPSARRRGLGARLIDELELFARKNGLSTLRLDTHHDLIEACRLYVRSGYREVPAFNKGPRADRWFIKTLT